MDEAPQRVWDFLATHAYTVVFIGTAIDAAGGPFPRRLMLVAAGSLAASGGASLPTLLALATVAAALGDHAWFVAGRVGGRRVTRLYCRLVRFAVPDCAERAAAYVERFGGLAGVAVALGAVAMTVAAAPFVRRCRRQHDSSKPGIVGVGGRAAAGKPGSRTTETEQWSEAM